MPAWFPPAGAATEMQHWRLQASARVSKPVGMMSVSIGCTAMLRSAIHGLINGKGLLGTMVEVLNVSVYPTLLSLPAMAVHSGCTATLLQPACIASHVIRSLALWSVGMGLAPAASGVLLPLQVQIELVLELALGIQDQMSLPIMAVLHALRQAGWMSIVIWCMEGDPYRTLIRGLLNWMAMMLLTGLFELRTWSAYQKHCRAQQQLQEQEQLPAPAHLLSLEASPEFISDLPSPDKPAKGQGGSGSSAQEKRPISPDDMSSSNRVRPLEVLHPSDHDDKTFKAAQLQAAGGDSAPAAKPCQTSIGVQPHRTAVGSRGSSGRPCVLPEPADCAPRGSLSSQVPLASSPADIDMLVLQSHHLASSPRPSFGVLESPSLPIGGTAPSALQALVMEQQVNAESSLLGSSEADAGVCIPPQGRHVHRLGMLGTAPLVTGPALDRNLSALSTEERTEEELQNPAAIGAQERIAGGSSGEVPLTGNVTPVGAAPGMVVLDRVSSALASTRGRCGSLDHPMRAAAGVAGPEAGLDAKATAMRLLRQARSSSQRLETARSLLRMMGQQRSLPYQRIPRHAASPVHVKVKGLEVEQLPADLPALMHEQLRHCMPGSAMAGLALRSGCVMLTLDLMQLAEAAGTPAAQDSLAGGMAHVITRLMQSQAMGQVLEDGAIMCIQASGEVLLRRWDASSSTYQSTDLNGQTLGPLNTADLTACSLSSVKPAVYCLPEAVAVTDGSPEDDGQQLTLTVELQLPPNCQLHGWQPTGAAAPAGVGKLPEGSVPHGEPTVDAMLLARRVGGGYLLVDVKSISFAGLGSSGSQQEATAQVVVTLNDAAPAGLQLELWCKKRAMEGTAAAGAVIEPSSSSVTSKLVELLVSHMPLLVLPSSWKEAASELQQHVKDMGMQPVSAPVAPAQHAGHCTLDSAEELTPASASAMVGTQLISAPDRPQAASHASEGPAACLLQDLGLLLTYRPGPSQLLDGMVLELGGNLLVYAIQHGLLSLASHMVEVLEQRQAQAGAGASAPSAWLLAACGGPAEHEAYPGNARRVGRSMDLLHAVMTTGNPRALDLVLRWGVLYGGPNWAWPWELEAEHGLTPLHLAAVQPAATCIAVLETISLVLPAAQVEAARSVWLHCLGGIAVNMTPAELFEGVSGNASPGAIWRAETLPLPANVTNNEEKCITGASTSAWRSTLEAGLAGTTSTPAEKPPTSPRPDFKAQSFLESMVDVWVTPETDEYHAWAKKQMSSLVCSWAATLLSMGALSIWQSNKAGTLQDELPVTFFHTVCYIPIMASASGASWMPAFITNWQTWMLASHVFHSMAFMTLSLKTLEQIASWAAATRNYADVIYTAVLLAPLDQTPLRQLFWAQISEGFFHGMAYRTAKIPDPLLRSIWVHALGLLLTTICRAHQLRSFRNWQLGSKGSQGKANWVPAHSACSA